VIAYRWLVLLLAAPLPLTLLLRAAELHLPSGDVAWLPLLRLLDAALFTAVGLVAWTVSGRWEVGTPALRQTDDAVAMFFGFRPLIPYLRLQFSFKVVLFGVTLANCLLAPFFPEMRFDPDTPLRLSFNLLNLMVLLYVFNPQEREVVGVAADR